jgi:hypothetical protein
MTAVILNGRFNEYLYCNDHNEMQVSFFVRDDVPGTGIRAQHKGDITDSIFTDRSIPAKECPAGLLRFVNTDLLQNKSALFIFNEALHPLSKNGLRDSKRAAKFLSARIKMNRCALLYIDSGVHRFHTIYQRRGEAVLFRAGDFFMAVLTTRTVWPPFFPVIIKDRKAEEYGPVLMHYINGARATELLIHLKKKEVIVNQQ